jgi:hypothetical protein
MPDGWDGRPKEIRGRIDFGFANRRAPSIIGRNEPGQQDEAALQCRSGSLIGIKRRLGENDYR